WRGDGRDGDAGAFGEIARGNAVDQAQGVEHVFERQFRRGHLLRAFHAFGARRLFHVGQRHAAFPATLDAQRAGRVVRHLAVRTGADAEVVAERPVIEIVRTTP